MAIVLLKRENKKLKKVIDKRGVVCYTNQAVSSGRAQETVNRKKF